MLRAMVWALVLAAGAAAAARADVVGVDWTTTGTASGGLITVTGSLQGKTATLTTNALGNAGAIATTGWGNAVFYPSYLGAFAPAEAATIGFQRTTTAQNQSVTFSSAITGPNIYLLFNYVQSGSVYDFTGLNPTMVSTTFNTGSTATLSGQEVTYTSTNASSNLEGFIVRLSGTSYSNIAFTTRNSTTVAGNSTNWFTVGVGTAVPEPGTLLLGGIAAASGGAGVWWRRRKRQPAPVELGPELETV